MSETRKYQEYRIEKRYRRIHHSLLPLPLPPSPATVPVTGKLQLQDTEVDEEKNLLEGKNNVEVIEDVVARNVLVRCNVRFCFSGGTKVSRTYNESAGCTVVGVSRGTRTVVLGPLATTLAGIRGLVEENR
jgi:hypothetical protein